MRTGAALTCMDSTIGRCVGNSLEVIESLETLKGKGPDDLMELVTTLGNVWGTLKYSSWLGFLSEDIKFKFILIFGRLIKYGIKNV